MKKSSERGRGKGRGASTDDSRTGCGGGAPKKRHSLSAVLSRPKTTLSNPEEQDQVVNWLTSQASSSGLSSTSPSLSCTRSSASHKDKEPVATKVTQPAATHNTQRPNSESEQLQHDTMADSQELFPPPQSSRSERSMEQPQILCPDSMSERQSEDEDTQISLECAQVPESQEVCVQHDERMGLRCAEVVLGSSSPVHTCEEEEMEEEVVEEEVVDDEVVDDEVTDPTWEEAGHRRRHSSTDQSTEEPAPARVRVVPQSSQGQGRSATRSAQVRRKRPTRQTPIQSSRSSKVWSFFEDSKEDVTMVNCKVCRCSMSRGKNVNNLTTTSMRRHMLAKHPTLWSNAHGQGTGTLPAPSNTASVVDTRPSSAAQPLRVAQTSVLPDVSGNSSALECSQSSTTTNCPSVCEPTVQLSVPEMLQRRRKMPANDPRAIALTATIARFLACEMLPYRLVETESFRCMMSMAIPRYVVPSRHYFARCAVPALHEYVVGKITRSLKNAVACKVHLTTDTWTSAFGQGRYISLTAHWVNLVEPGSDSSPAMAQVLPTPQIAGPASLRVNDSTYLSGSFSSSASPSSTSSGFASCTSPGITSPGIANPATGGWKRCSTAVAMRQQALLKLICLGDKQHTGAEIWNGIKAETQLWLAPLGLEAGLVVCDNGSNLIRALQIAKLTHIPCLAHIMNLVVQRFLRTYPGVADLLLKVRRVSKHFRKSSTASDALTKAQQRFGLPNHRLLCDVPTRWNSTLHMLARLCEQKSAVVQFLMDQYRGASSQLPIFCGSEWATMLDLCEVLQNFEQSTLLVSGDNSLVSITIPLLCLLKKSMLQIKEDAIRMEEEELREDTDHRSSASVTAGPLYEEDEEEEQLELGQELDASTAEGHGREDLTCTIQREWTVEQNEDEGWQHDAGDGASQQSSTLDDDEQPVGTLAHMAQFMLGCIERDTRIVRILADVDYWVFTLLDPRYKENVQTLIEESVRQEKMEEYQKALVEKLERRFASSSSHADRLTNANPGGLGGEQRTEAAASGHKGTASAVSKVWQSFLSPRQQPTAQPSRSSTSNTDRLQRMVKDYMSDGITVLNNPSVPFNYWVSKLDTWHELAMYAIEVLACPAASVMSERCFSAAGGIITERRTRLSTESADRLTQIKMNKAWIGNDFATPPDQAP